MSGETFDFSTLPEDQQLACYGAYFAMAGADGVIENDELVAIFESLDTSTLSDAGRNSVRNYLLAPPPLEGCLQTVGSGPEGLRYGLMLRLVEVALADDVVLSAEADMLAVGQGALGITSEQVDGMRAFLAEVKRVRERGIDDSDARESLKAAAATLGGLGVPVAAIAFSGNVLSLGASGVIAGLASLGLGFGLVPGMGMAMLLGTASFMTLSWALGRGKESPLEEASDERSRLLVENVTGTISFLADRISDLEEQDAPRDEVTELRRRLQAMQRVLAAERGDLQRDED